MRVHDPALRWRQVASRQTARRGLVRRGLMPPVRVRRGVFALQVGGQHHATRGSRSTRPSRAVDAMIPARNASGMLATVDMDVVMTTASGSGGATPRYTVSRSASWAPRRYRREVLVTPWRGRSGTSAGRRTGGGGSV